MVRSEVPLGDRTYNPADDASKTETQESKRLEALLAVDRITPCLLDHNGLERGVLNDNGCLANK